MMVSPTLAIQGYLRKLGLDKDKDFHKESVRIMSQMVIEVEVQVQTGAAKYERTLERKAQRNGYRGWIWETREGEIHLRIPKLHTCNYFPSFLDPSVEPSKPSWRWCIYCGKCEHA